MEGRQEARGVYRLPWIGPSGQRYYVAVDRRGRRRFKATAFDGYEDQSTVDSLWVMLDREDPDPLIRLVS